MKARRVMGITVILLGLLLAGGLSTVQAANYLGEFCWQASGGGVAKFAVTDMGDGHFLLNGRSIDQGVIGAGLGNAEVVGSQIYMTVTFSGADVNDTWVSIGRVVLDLANLNGSVESIDVDHSKTNPSTSNAQASYHGVQTLTFVTCP